MDMNDAYSELVKMQSAAQDSDSPETWNRAELGLMALGVVHSLMHYYHIAAGTPQIDGLLEPPPPDLYAEACKQFNKSVAELAEQLADTDLFDLK